MVTFSQSTGSEVCVVLGVNEDGEVEGAETLIVRLVSAVNPLTIDPTMDMATITILDIEGEWTIIIFPPKLLLALHFRKFVNIITVCRYPSKEPSGDGQRFDFPHRLY